MNKILICTDGSEYSEACYHYGTWLSQKMHSELHIVHVTELTDLLQPSLAMGSTFKSAAIGEKAQDLFDQIQTIEKGKSTAIETHAKEFFSTKKFDDKVTFHQRTGDLVKCVQDFELGSESVDLVVLGKRGEHASFAKEHLGSSLERIVRHSTKPCLVANRHARPVNKLLLAFDGSSSSQKAISFFKQNPSFQDLELHLATVINNSGPNEEKMKRFEEAYGDLTAHGYEPIKKVIENNHVEEGIASYVEDKKIDMLTMGAYGHNRIRHLIIGSVTTTLVRCCHVPVMLFR